jgi:tRNA modification GTPase
VAGLGGDSEDDSEDDEGLQGGSSGTADTATIAAIVTGAQQGAVSIIRLSGGDAVGIAQAAFRPSGPRAAAVQRPGQAKSAAWQPESHRIYYGSAVDGQGGVLDEVLLLAMLRPRSYTAEDVIEIHTHGGGISAQRVLQVGLWADARAGAAGMAVRASSTRCCC